MASAHSFPREPESSFSLLEIGRAWLQIASVRGFGFYGFFKASAALRHIKRSNLTF